MFEVIKVAPTYRKEDIIVRVCVDDTIEGALEGLRNYFLQCNQRIVDRAEELDIPDIILNTALTNIERNPSIVFEVKEDGTVFIDEQGPEMDYYKIQEIH